MKHFGWSPPTLGGGRWAITFNTTQNYVLSLVIIIVHVHLNQNLLEIHKYKKLFFSQKVQFFGEEILQTTLITRKVITISP